MVVRKYAVKAGAVYIEKQDMNGKYNWQLDFIPDDGGPFLGCGYKTPDEALEAAVRAMGIEMSAGSPSRKIRASAKQIWGEYSTVQKHRGTGRILE